MSQDTRKDKRAKVVSLNVRYKSATVDEFIENHSHDVSKGGLFVKTPTPFPPGTLLKFEIRLAGDKSVISGVGRVVWKREPTQAGGAEKPAGMGVKFIKIDDSSRAVIDRLIAQKADAGSAYTSEQPIDEAVPVGHPSTLRGLVAAPVAEPAAAPGPSPVNAPAPSPGGTGKLPVPPAAALPPPVAKKPALAGPGPGNLPNVAPPVVVPPPAPSSKPGLGAPKPAPRPAGPPPPVANKPSTAVGVGPAPAAIISPAAVAGKAPEKLPSEPTLAAERPPVPATAARKATMMGMPTPSPPKAEAAPAPASAAPAVARGTAEPMFPRLDPESGNEPARDQTVMKQAAELLEEALKEAGGSLDEIGQNPLFSQAGEAVQSGDTMIMTSPIPSGASPSSPLGDDGPLAPRSGVEAASVIAASSPSQPLVFDSPASVPLVPTTPRKLSADLGEPKKKGGGAGPLVGLFVAALLVGGGVYAWQTGLLGGAIGPEKGPPSASTTPPPPPSSTPSATNSAPVVATTGLASSDAATPTATADAAAVEVDAGKPATTAVAPPPPPPAPPAPPTPVKPTPRPPAPPKPPAPPPVDTTPPATAEPPPPPPPAPTPVPTSATPPAPTMEPWSPP